MNRLGLFSGVPAGLGFTVLFEHPQIKEAAVVGVPDEYCGETVKAFIVLRDGAAASAKEIISFCRGRLAAYKVPR